LQAIPIKVYPETRISQRKAEKNGARRVILWFLFHAFLPQKETLQRAMPREKHKFAFSQILSFFASE